MDDDRADLVSQLFAQLTAQLEDSVTLAVEGQGRQPLTAQYRRAAELEARLRDAHAIARGVVMLTQPGDTVGERPGPTAD